MRRSLPILALFSALALVGLALAADAPPVVEPGLTVSPAPAAVASPAPAASPGPAAKSVPVKLHGKEKKPLPREMFDHNFHEKHFNAVKYECTNCHTYKVDRQSKTVLEIDYQKFFTKPLAELCHPCHREQGQIRSRLYVCSTCHTEPQAIVPANHRSGWIKKHASLSYNAKECRNCHDDSYCINCHRRFETIKPRVHSRNYRFFHSIEARTSPARCYACHRETQCRQCHSTGSAFR